MTTPLFDGRAFAAMLFDMDGTVLNSIAATERAWTRWSERLGLDARAVLRDIHGRRAADTVRGLNMPALDVDAEAAEIMRMEMADTEGVEPVPGVREFLRSLPDGRWAIVTSAPRELAVVRLEAAGLEVPEIVVTADDISRGKPDPSGYQLAARQLRVSISDCVAFEDAAAGIQAAEAAGAAVIVITATHSRPMATPHPALRSFEGLRVEVTQGRMKLYRGDAALED